MPLIEGYSDSIFEANVAQLIEDGYSVEQAVAIANTIRTKAKGKAGLLSSFQNAVLAFAKRSKLK